MKHHGPTEKHDRTVDHYFNHPFEIEQGFKTLYREFGVGSWRRIDILGIDKNRNLCIVEIKTGKYTQPPLNQVIKYRLSLMRLFEALSQKVSIRIIIITQDKRFEVPAAETIIQPELPKVPGIPTSREIFGLTGLNNLEDPPTAALRIMKAPKMEVT